MASVFLVTSGEYSDYRVECAFSTKELADAQVVLWNGEHLADHYRVEECELDDEIHSPEWVTSAYLRRNGDEYSFPSSRHAHPDMKEVNCVYCCGEYMVSQIAGQDHERARKVANERRAAIIAADAWGDDAKANAILFGVKS